MIWFLLQQIGFFIFLLLTIKFVIQKRHESLLILYFFGLVFGTCFYFAITIWSPSKVVSIGMLVSMLRFDAKKDDKILIIKIIAILLLILIIVSSLIALILPGPLPASVNPIQRLLIQDFGYLTAILLLFYGSGLKRGFATRIFPKYCIAVEIAIITGLIHYIFNKIGVEFAPILRTDGINENKEVVANFGGDIVQRIYGFAGEPKNFGFLVAPYLVMSFFSYFRGIIRVNSAYHLIFLALGFFVVQQTYSSSALITVILSIAGLLVFYKLNIRPKLVGIVIIIIGSLLSYSFLKESVDVDVNNNSFWSALENRTFGRAQDELENDRQEVIIWETFTEDKTIYQLFGYGIGQYSFHVPGQIEKNTIIPVQSGLVVTLVDLGFVGALFYVLYGCLIIFYLVKSKNLKKSFSSYWFILVFVTYIGGTTYGNLITSFMLFMLAVNNFYTEQQMHYKVGKLSNKTIYN
ncbi:hypothetical protein [Chryseobacterium foetidum]|uniref:hypothetical protein n=1 Tax=Chryseobacterium foetidum TaxID=2951057 RepID=UPI0021C9125A|nr:hypothetical protein [Chryseobacterium foetidum]